MNKVPFDKHRCKGCGMCVLFCPQKILRMSADLNDQGFSYPEVSDPDRCTACGMCFRMCPDCAIQVDKEGVKTSDKKETTDVME